MPPMMSDADTLIHLTHMAVPGPSMGNSSYDVESNVDQTVGWISRIAETYIGRIIYFSSGGAVYGSHRFDLIVENHPTILPALMGLPSL